MITTGHKGGAWDAVKQPTCHVTFMKVKQCLLLADNSSLYMNNTVCNNNQGPQQGCMLTYQAHKSSCQTVS